MIMIGHGAMGLVFKAKQENLDRDVALKTMLVSKFSQPKAMLRFKKEAHSLAKLSHPHILTLS